MPGVGSLALIQKSGERARVGRGRKLDANCEAMAWMRSQRFGVFTTRRMEREPFSLRYCAMATFAATMKLSMMSSVACAG